MKELLTGGSVTFSPTLFVRTTIVQQAHLWGQFVEQNVLLSFSLRSDQIHNIGICEYGHTLLWCISLTYVLD